jgi:hypothetical protein
MKMFARAMCVGVGLLGFSLPAEAVMPVGPASLSPGGTVSPVPGIHDEGSEIFGEQTLFFGGTGSGPSGSLFDFLPNSIIYHPYGETAINFAFGLDVTGGDVASIVIPGFAGFLTSVAACNFTGCEYTGAVPTGATRSANGDDVTFTWSTPISAGDDSAIFAVYTNATEFKDPPMIEIANANGDISTVSGFFAPTVPEPSVWAMMLLGFGGLGLVHWRKNEYSRVARSAIRSGSRADP